MKNIEFNYVQASIISINVINIVIGNDEQIRFPIERTFRIFRQSIYNESLQKLEESEEDCREK